MDMPQKHAYMKTAFLGWKKSEKRLIFAIRGVANLIQLTTAKANELWNVVRC